MSEHITIQPISPKDFRSLTPQIVDAFADALIDTSPWYTVISKPKTRRRFLNYSRGSGFGTIVAMHGTLVAGMTMYRKINAARQITQSGDFGNYIALRDLLELIAYQHNIHDIVVLDTTFVTPQFRRQHIATNMRQRALAEIQEAYPQGVIVFTQHLMNNPGIIKSSETLGFRQLGITSGENEYWYKVLEY